MGVADFGVWKHPAAHGIAEVGYAAALSESMHIAQSSIL